MHHVLRRIWTYSGEHDGWWVGDYIVMPDHVHLFAQPQIEARSLAGWMQTWKSVTARQIARTIRINLPVWQPDDFDRYLRSSDNYSEKCQHVFANPVRAKLVTRAEDWPYTGRIYHLMV